MKAPQGCSAGVSTKQGYSDLNLATWAATCSQKRSHLRCPRSVAMATAQTPLYSLLRDHLNQYQRKDDSNVTKAAESLDATVLDMRWVKPLDEKLIDELSHTHALLVTIEDNAMKW